jgi:hypothetical protein
MEGNLNFIRFLINLHSYLDILFQVVTQIIIKMFVIYLDY